MKEALSDKINFTELTPQTLKIAEGTMKAEIIRLYPEAWISFNQHPYDNILHVGFRPACSAFRIAEIKGFDILIGVDTPHSIMKKFHTAIERIDTKPQFRRLRAE